MSTTTKSAYVIDATAAKMKKPLMEIFIRALFAGSCIAMGAIGFFKIFGAAKDPGLGLFFGALVFPFGIIAILARGYDLFTSNCMMSKYWFAHNSGIRKVAGLLVLVWTGNLLGSVALAGISKWASIYSPHTLDIIIHKAQHKVAMPVSELIWSGVLCNLIVCAGVSMAYSAKEPVSKFLNLYLAIVVFVLSGTEHCVANMYYLFTAFFGGGELSLAGIFYNLSFVTLGNLIGGALLIAGLDYLIERKQTK